MKDNFPCAVSFLPDGAAQGTAVCIVSLVMLNAVCGEYAAISKRLDTKVFDNNADSRREGGKRIAGAVMIGFT